MLQKDFFTKLWQLPQQKKSRNLNAFTRLVFEKLGLVLGYVLNQYTLRESRVKW